MSRIRRFFAPAKLMLAGEYSVLAPGGLALAVALDPPGLLAEAHPAATWELRRPDCGARWRPGEPVPEELAFVQAGWQGALDALGGAASPHRLELRTAGEVGVGEAKPGVGGSASAAALGAAALLGLAGQDPARHRAEVLRIALAAHRRVQGGDGSGYDVATVTWGGLVRWSPADAAPVGHPWPEEIGLLAGYSGASASTTHFIARFNALAAVDPAAFAGEMARLIAPVRLLAGAAERGDGAALCGAVDPCQRALEAWDARCGLGVVTPALARMIGEARELGVAAKVSGAGGGDSAVALDPDPERLARLARRWRELGFAPFPLRPCPTGVCERRATHP